MANIQRYYVNLETREYPLSPQIINGVLAALAKAIKEEEIRDMRDKRKKVIMIIYIRKQ